jgi:type IV pilus assembly protein PilO
MRKNFNLSSLSNQWREPRVLLRGVIGALLLANIVAAIIAFKPFGGGADDLTREEAALQQQLTSMRQHIAASKMLVEKMQNSRRDRDQFLAKYVADARIGSSTMLKELDRIATQAGVKQLPVSYNYQDIEGSDTFRMVTVTEGEEGSYASLAKFINLVDKSPNFLIIESLSTSAPQNGGALSLQLKIDTFINGSEGTP